MKTAVISGASAGVGAEFALKIRDYFPDIECIWLIARRAEKLDAVAAKLEGVRVKCLPLDLCAEGAFVEYAAALAEENPRVSVLINNAGCGYLGSVWKTPLADQTRMVDLNLRALTALTALTVPYMERGGRIINMSSIASFCPNPGMTVYSAGKSYVSAFSRGLGEELKPMGIGVTAVCPGPMKTEFLDIGGITGNSKMFEMLPYSEPAGVVRGALAAAKKGRAVYTHKGLFRLYRVLAKLLPHSIVVKFAKT